MSQEPVALYTILGVGRRASPDDIAAAYAAGQDRAAADVIGALLAPGPRAGAGS